AWSSPRVVARNVSNRDARISHNRSPPVGGSPFERLEKPRAVGLICPNSTLIAPAVPPAQEDAALEDAAGVVPAPASFVGQRSVSFAQAQAAATDRAAGVTTGVGRLGEARGFHGEASAAL